MSAKSEILANVLRTSWRASPSDLEITEQQLGSVVPMLTGSGASPLAWWRIQNSPLRDTTSGAQLYDVFRQAALHNAVQEVRLIQTLERLRSEGLDPLVIKGWSVARLYPDVALHPFGDMDLAVRPADRARAESLAQTVYAGIDMDFEHAWLRTLDGPAWEDLYGRSQTVRAGETHVRVLGPADQLRSVCLHGLQHGLWRPLWLVDIAAVLESRGPDFDWDVCLGSDPLRADWIACVLGLAHVVLGADLSGTPVAERAAHLPRWLVPAVLKQWETPTTAEHGIEDSILDARTDPIRLARILHRRWWDPIRLSVWAEEPFSARSRLPLHLRNVIWQTRGFLARHGR